MSGITITAYQPGDVEAVVALLQEALPVEAITTERFARIVLLDPNFDPSGALVRRDKQGKVCGFLLALTRQRPLEDAPLETDRGWITLFAVAEAARGQGIGSALLDAAESWLRDRDRETVWISPYAPGYWTPGVDEAAYPEGLAFLQRRGYETAYRPLSMDSSLVGWRPPAWVAEREQMLMQAGVRFETFSPSGIGPLLDFLRREFPGDWQRHMRETMHSLLKGHRPAEELLLAWDGEKVIGFAQSEGERFGPFGVGANERGRGLGAVLLAKALEGMRIRGLHNAWFLWTNDTTADRLYRSVSFRETRRYAVLKKALS